MRRETQNTTMPLYAPRAQKWFSPSVTGKVRRGTLGTRTIEEGFLEGGIWVGGGERMKGRSEQKLRGGLLLREE